MRVCFLSFFLLILFSHGVLATEPPTPKQNPQDPAASPPPSTKHYKFFPVPVIETRPNEGITGGLMGVMMVTNAENIIYIMTAVSAEYNTITHTGGAINFFYYPTTDSKIEVSLELAQEVAKEFAIEYFNPKIWHERLHLFSKVGFNENPFARFYGLGEDTPESNETSHTLSSFTATTEIGYYLIPTLRLALSETFIDADLEPALIQSLPETSVVFSPGRGFFESHHLIHGGGVIFDNRPEGEISRKGHVARAFYRWAHREVASTTTFHGWELSSVHLIPTWGERLTTAVNFDLMRLFGNNIPYYLRSDLGGDSLRGYPKKRFVDQGRIVATIEERILIRNFSLMDVKFKLFIDPFFSLGRVFDQFSHLSFHNIKPAGGVGFRAMVPPNVLGRVDLGFSEEGIKVFTGLGYPF